MNDQSPPLGLADEPLVSVLVPVFNHAEYVAATIESVASQSYGRIEIVITDDGSTDGSDKVVEESVARFRASFEQVDCRVQPNRGLSATLNDLVQRANGSILVPIASDDLLLPDALETRVRAFRMNPDAIAVFTDCQTMDAAGRIVHRSGIAGLHKARPGALRNNRILAELFLLHWCVPGPVLSIRSDAIELLGGSIYDEQRFPEDFDLYLRLARSRRLHFVVESTAQYRLHDGSTTSTQRDRLRRGIRETVEAQRPHMRRSESAIAWLLLEVSAPVGRWNPRRLAARTVFVGLRKCVFWGADTRERLRRLRQQARGQ